ncbi:MAG: hypothetical protein IKL57_08120 [Oscillospiraceae bacterium]|nr:hypothetical protein [Oscillospiraceae bacterium]
MCNFDDDYIVDSNIDDNFDSVTDYESEDCIDSVNKTIFEDFSLDEIDDGKYHASKLSEEEVERIDDLWKEKKVSDVEVYHANHLNDDEIELLSLDELETKNESADIFNDDKDIFLDCDINTDDTFSENKFDEFTQGLSKEELEHLRDGLIVRDGKVMDYYGFNSDEENSDSSEELVLKRKL